MQQRRQSLGIQVSLLMLTGFAVLQLLPTDFPFVHTHDSPVYHADDHDVCRALGWTFVVFLAWYFALMVGLLRTKHAVESSWGQRLLIWPNLAIGILGLLGCFALYRSFYSHSEEGFARIMGFLNGLSLGTIIIYVYTIASNPVAEGYKYGYNLLMFVSIPILAFLTGMYVYEEQVLAAAFIGAALLPFLWAAVDLKSYANKQPYKF